MKLWQGQLDSNQRMSASKTDAFPLGYTPVSIKHDLHASIVWLSNPTATPHPRSCLIRIRLALLICPILAYSVSKSTHRAMGKFASPYPTFPEALVYLVPWRWVRHYNGTPMGGTGDGIPELHWRRWSYTILNFLPSCCHTIAVAAASFLLFEKPSRNPPNQTGFMAAGLGFEPKDGLSPSPDFKTSALNQTLPSRHNLSMMTLYFGLSYEAVMPAANSQSR